MVYRGKGEQRCARCMHVVCMCVYVCVAYVCLCVRVYLCVCGLFGQGPRRPLPKGDGGEERGRAVSDSRCAARPHILATA